MSSSCEHGGDPASVVRAIVDDAQSGILPRYSGGAPEASFDTHVRAAYPGLVHDAASPALKLACAIAGSNRSYARSSAEGLLRECGIDNWRLVRFHQEFEPGSRLAQGLSRLLPATRLIYDIGFALSGPAHSKSAKRSSATDSLNSPDGSERAARSSDARV